MEFGMDKCKILHVTKRNSRQVEITKIFNNKTLKNMKRQETYRYLAFEQKQA